jgi:virulence factor Mce-like protein
MRPRGGQGSELFGNPTLIGAVTTLVAIVGLLLAYNANNGLPFVPTYNIRALVPDAAELTPGNEVRVGGKRVGVITEIDARGTRSGVPVASLQLKLEKRIEPISADSQVTVRPRSTLGLKYLELRPGRGAQKVSPGGSLALERAQPIVELDEVINAFDAQTRAGLQGVLGELGDGVAGRGLALNQTLEALPALAGHLQAVAANLRSPRTDLRGLIRGLAATTGAVAPVAASLGRLVQGAAVTLDALAAAGGALGEAISETPATESVATRVFVNVRPVVADTAAFVRAAAPGVRLLGPTSRRLSDALDVGVPVLRRAAGLADRLGRTLRALEGLVRDPATGGSIRKLTVVVSSLEGTLRFANPFQVRCNYLGLWTRNASSVVSEGDGNGTWFRFIPVAQTSETFQTDRPAPELHVNQYPFTGQNGECEAGNEPYLPGQRIGNPPGRQPGGTEATSPPAGVRAP